MRRIAGVKRIDKRRMEELRAKVGWRRGKNGKGTIGEESICAWSGG